MRRFYIIICSVILSSSIGYSQSTLFELLDSRKSGIDFENRVIDDERVNPFIYDNIYSGSGVAIGDLNNDGLLDIYLGGNQVSDEMYLNKGKLRFEKVTSKAGILDKGGWTSGVTMIDINQDGWLDIYVCKSLHDEPTHLRTNELYINQGDLTFKEAASEYGLADTWRSQQATFFDYDNDGDLDLFLVNQPPNPGMLSKLKGKDWRYPALGCRLMKNENGKFIDVSKEANVFDRGYGLSATSGDFNNDGWLDLYVSNDYNNPDFLYINQGDGTFKNTIDESMGHISYFSMGIDIADINNDNLVDILTVDMVPEDNYNLKANMGGMYPAAFWATVENGGHYQYMLNTLQLNRGTNESQTNIFSEIAQYIGAAYTDWSWSPLMADFNNDGHKDIYITNGLVRDLRNTDALENITTYLKEKTPEMQAMRESNGKIGMWEAASLDTLLGYYPVRKVANYAFQNNGDLGFEKTAREWGLDDKTFSTGAAYGDLDNDGDLELVVSNINDKVFIYENKLEDANSLRVQLESANEDVIIGSRVEISVNGTKQYYEFANSRGFYSTSEPVAHFGIGSADMVDEVVVNWANGGTTKLQNVKSGIVRITSDQSKGSRQTNQAEFSYFSEKIGEYNILHKENTFDDYEREILLPHQMSKEGPRLAITDLNGDGSDEFYLPGAMGASGLVSGSIDLTLKAGEDREEVAALFFDADNDQDDDLYVVTGGNELESGDVGYQDLFYVNNDGTLEISTATPDLSFSGSMVISEDFDSDGDMDLFVGGRQIPAAYPSPASSYIFKNLLSETGSLNFEDATEQIAPELEKIGMVTDATWSDFDQDGDKDLIIVGEWMGIQVMENIDGKFIKKSTELQNETGWWNHINATDLDNDGDEDYVVGNLGLNYKFIASEEEPFVVYYDDFDENGKNDIVLGYYNFGDLYPVRGRSCSSQQIPDIKKKFKNYDAFASANIFQVYGEQALNGSLTLEATNFGNSFIENLGDGNFRISRMPYVTQISPINSTVFYDLNEDGLMDIIYAGNKYGTEVETPRADAGIGGVLLNKGDMNFEPVDPNQSGLFLNSHVKDLKIIRRGTAEFLLVGSNNGPTRVFQINN